MKTLKMRELLKIATLMALVIIFSTSCKDDDDPVLPDYVGTWETMQSVQVNGEYVQVKDIMKFTETSYSKVSQIQVGTNWVDMVSAKGALLVTGNIMNVTITEIGVTNLMGVTTTYKKGESEFDAMLSANKQLKTFESKFSVTGNKLTLQIDYNTNGNYLDEMETSVYTKQ